MKHAWKTAIRIVGIHIFCAPQDRNMLHEQFLAMDRQKRGAPRDLQVVGVGYVVII